MPESISEAPWATVCWPALPSASQAGQSAGRGVDTGPAAADDLGGPPAIQLRWDHPHESPDPRPGRQYYGAGHSANNAAQNLMTSACADRGLVS